MGGETGKVKNDFGLAKNLFLVRSGKAKEKNPELKSEPENRERKALLQNSTIRRDDEAAFKRGRGLGLWSWTFLKVEEVTV